MIQQVCIGCGEPFVGGHGCYCDDCAAVPIHSRAIKREPRQRNDARVEAKVKERSKRIKRTSIKYADV